MDEYSVTVTHALGIILRHNAGGIDVITNMIHGGGCEGRRDRGGRCEH